MKKVSKEMKILISAILVFGSLFIFAFVSNAQVGGGSGGAGGGGAGAGGGSGSAGGGNAGGSGGSGGAGGGNAGGSGGSGNAGASQIFGGRISSITKCTCPASAGATAVIISSGGTNAQFDGTYLQTAATRLLGKSQISPTKNIIGKYQGSGTCMIAGDPCSEGPVITKGAIQMAATN